MIGVKSRCRWCQWNTINLLPIIHKPILSQNLTHKNIMNITMMYRKTRVDITIPQKAIGIRRLDSEEMAIEIGIVIEIETACAIALLIRYKSECF